MNKFNGKFELVYEQTLGRYQQGGFLTGDYVKIKADALKHKNLQDITEEFKELIKSLRKRDIPLRISFIKTRGGSGSSNGVVGGADAPTDFFADVSVEHGPGMWDRPITLPIGVLSKVELDEFNGYPPVSDEIVYPDRTQIKPEKVSDVKFPEPNK